MDQDHLKQVLTNKKVAIIGDVMLDRYIVGKVERMSPEAPVPVLLHQKSIERLGGAANVAYNIHTLGSHPLICALVGKDEDGDRLQSLLGEIGCDSQYLVSSDTRKTTVKTRLLAKSQHLLRLDSESQGQVDLQDHTALKRAIDNLLANEEIDIVILQDYNKGVLSSEIIDYVINICKEKNVFVSVDPKFENFFNYKHVNLFKPNLNEISQALGQTVKPDLDELNLASQELGRRMSFDCCMITLSDQGVYLKRDAEDGVVVPTHRSEINDVCGAGDAVLAVSSLMLFSGLGVEEVGVVANSAGGIVCQKVGVAPIWLNELIIDR